MSSQLKSESVCHTHLRQCGIEVKGGFQFEAWKGDFNLLKFHYRERAIQKYGTQPALQLPASAHLALQQNYHRKLIAAVRQLDGLELAVLHIQHIVQMVYERRIESAV